MTKTTQTRGRRKRPEISSSTKPRVSLVSASQSRKTIKYKNEVPIETTCCAFSFAIRVFAVHSDCLYVMSMTLYSSISSLVQIHLSRLVEINANARTALDGELDSYFAVSSLLQVLFTKSGLMMNLEYRVGHGRYDVSRNSQLETMTLEWLERYSYRHIRVAGINLRLLVPIRGCA